MPDDKNPPVRAAMRRYKLTTKSIGPIVTQTVEFRDVPSIEDLLRRLLAEDQAELDRWRHQQSEKR